MLTPFYRNYLSFYLFYILERVALVQRQRHDSCRPEVGGGGEKLPFVNGWLGVSSLFGCLLVVHDHRQELTSNTTRLAVNEESVKDIEVGGKTALAALPTSLPMFSNTAQECCRDRDGRTQQEHREKERNAGDR